MSIHEHGSIVRLGSLDFTVDEGGIVFVVEEFKSQSLNILS
jgi:hypothetical protein